MRQELYHKLEQLLFDVVREEQIKLGYQEETIRFYYPLEPLAALLGRDSTSGEWKQDLSEFKSYVRERLGDLTITGKAGRICFTIPPEGAKYVHDTAKDNPFLVEFIGLMSGGHASLDDIKEVFKKYTDHFVCKKIENGEFDYVLYFQNKSEDEYRYCVKFEGGHTIYHRFLPDDYAKMYD